MKSSQEPPDQKNFLPAPKKVIKSNNINNRSLGDISIIDETKCQDKKTSSHHIVDGLVVQNLEF